MWLFRPIALITSSRILKTSFFSVSFFLSKSFSGAALSQRLVAYSYWSLRCFWSFESGSYIGYIVMINHDLKLCKNNELVHFVITFINAWFAIFLFYKQMGRFNKDSWAFNYRVSRLPLFYISRKYFVFHYEVPCRLQSK